MTDLRKTAEMALEALEAHKIGNDHTEPISKTIQALRQALTQSNDEALLKQGWRQCAVGQRTTQYCGMAEQARLEEREACAKVCEEGIQNETDWDTSHWNQACENRAAAIRARSEK